MERIDYDNGETVLRLPSLKHHSKCPTPGSPCATCNKVTDVEKKISKTIYQLNKLALVYQSLKSELNHQHGAINKKLPVEIIAKIFVFATDADIQVISHTEDRRFIMWTLTLGAICTYWRQIAWSTPQLWTTILISLDRRQTTTDFKEAIRWIRRSGNLQVTTYVYTKDTNLEQKASFETRKGPKLKFPTCLDILGVVAKFSLRLKDLRVDIPMSLAIQMFERAGKMPQLNTLQLGLTNYDDPGNDEGLKIFKKSIPSPRHIVLLNKMPLKYCNIDWRRVSHVDGKELTRPQCKELFRLSGPALKSFSVDSVTDLPRLSSSSTLPETRIESMSLHFVGYAHIFNFVTFRNLRHLKVNTLGDPLIGVNALTVLLNQIKETIESVDLPIADLPLTLIRDIFNEGSSITHLRITPTRYGNCKLDNATTKEFLTHLAETSTSPTSGIVTEGLTKWKFLLPSLKSLEYDWSWSQRFPWEIALSIFGPPRSFDNPNFRPLRSLKVMNRTPSVVGIPREVLIRIQKLNKDGVNIQYR